MLNGLCKVCRTPRSFAAPKAFSVSGAPEMAITFTLRKARVSSNDQVEPIHFGHEYVGNDQVCGLLSVDGESEASIRCFRHLMAGPFKHDADESAE